MFYSNTSPGWSPHRADDTVGRIQRAELVVIDDVGLLPVSDDAAEGHYRIVDAAYEKRSIALSSNLHPAGFDELMPKTVATATIDRLLHHAHICQTSGDSIRPTKPAGGAVDQGFAQGLPAGRGRPTRRASCSPLAGGAHLPRPY